MITISNIDPNNTVNWGTQIIPVYDALDPSASTLIITNNGIINGSMVLTFEQFSINTNLAENEQTLIVSGPGVVSSTLWIQDFYNNPMSAFDSTSGTGDMKKDVYDIHGDGSVDKAETITFKTNNTSALQNVLIGADTPIILDDVIGVHIGGGVAVVKGVAKLNVKNISGYDMSGQTPLVPGVSVYKYDNGASLIGCVKSGIPGLRIETENEFFVGVVAGTYNINSDSIELIDVIIDIQRDSIYNPEQEGKWLREKRSNGSIQWTENINGGTF